jgi:hypothetical protein
MIIAKPEWFKRRKYTGWGVDIKTWQGGVYLAGILLSLVILILISTYYLQDVTSILIVVGVWMAFLIIDLSDVLWKLKKDERERMHEAIAERNAAWGMMLVLVIGLFVELVYNALQQRIYADPFIITALAVGVVIKGITNYRLEKTD